MSTTTLILLLGDIHANDAALAAVFADAHRRYPGHRLPVWFLGDLFGRGPRPAAAYRRLTEEQPEALIVGNHEGGLIGRYRNAHNGDTSSGVYNQDDWRVLLAHRRDLLHQGYLSANADGEINGPMADFIRRLPTVCAPRPGIYLVHGGYDQPFDPPPAGALDPLFHRLVWDYVKTVAQADYTLQAITWLATAPSTPAVASPVAHLGGPPASPRLVIVGHYHHRIFYAGNVWHSPAHLDHPYPLDPDTPPVLLSPGSVGFPADDPYDKDACYAILRLDDHGARAVTFHKVAYDYRDVRRQMATKGYPDAIVRRLRPPNETDAPADHNHLSGNAQPVAVPDREVI